MAKTSKIVANQRRIALVERYRERRDALRAQTKDASLTQAERQAASRALAALPRDSSPGRVRNRDRIDGRPRGYVGKAGLSRVRFRHAALRGELPGITKSSW
ncbi:MAG TPA: 30S ribosomal protein S14 [Propioniciclava sp.]|jgi:small subunit ribosomal protein S14|uniref:30S ribosomal protein S14 n=1 Tax=Propioniciclava sp. TaxID=2038686 RepID=UPI002C8B9438|nr:30S ribosomal protein S14 [Propioniciclava sp.]HRL49674.1 30S ribosomal protein S14 [Propioniciclava sp.]HRL81445.1 30S ribosomal protein S14 [Propioniciclava sp.]